MWYNRYRYRHLYIDYRYLYLSIFGFCSTVLFNVSILHALFHFTLLFIWKLYTLSTTSVVALKCQCIMSLHSLMFTHMVTCLENQELNTPYIQDSVL